MVLAGAAAGVWMATYRAQRAGVDRELIWSMAFWLFIGGMIGGRAFYVIEYWHERFATRQLPRDALAGDQLSRGRAGGLRRACSAA